MNQLIFECSLRLKLNAPPSGFSWKWPSVVIGGGGGGGDCEVVSCVCVGWFGWFGSVFGWCEFLLKLF